MFETRKKHLIAVALVLGAGAGGVVYSGQAPTAKDAYKVAQQRIDTQAKAQRKACGRFKDNAKDVCEAQAKGWEKLARAQLDAQYKPGPESEKKAKFARADADYEIAKERCDSVKDHAHDTCLEQAKHDHEAAIRLAKVEKVEEVNALKREAQAEREGKQKPAAVAHKPEAPAHKS